MIHHMLRRMRLICGLGAGIVALSACDPTYTGGSVGVGASSGLYYDSLLWNDYYYGGVRPPPPRPGLPDRPDRPVHPVPPIATLPGARPPIARPPVARPPIHRPAGGGRFR